MWIRVLQWLAAAFLGATGYHVSTGGNNASESDVQIEVSKEFYEECLEKSQEELQGDGNAGWLPDLNGLLQAAQGPSVGRWDKVQ